MRQLILLTIALTASAAAQTSTISEPSTVTRLWKPSIAALTVASALDAHSSWGKCCEANPLLPAGNGRFGAAAASVKAGALGGQLLFQTWAVRRWPRAAKPLAIINYATAGLLTGVAIRNYGIPRVR
jgi:hypothetical protein